jgi:hypothetical protein
MRQPAERGEASMLVALSDGIVTVTHGTDGSVLASGKVSAGAWHRIWEAMNREGIEQEGEV